MASIIISGFGGQGILFAGKQLAAAGMNIGKQVTWFPSYGAEMRGGSCNCSVNIDDEPIGSPQVSNPDILLALNKPSVLKFQSKVKSGGIAIIDSSLVDIKCTRDDIACYYIPASRLADQNGLKGLANVIMLGALLKTNSIFELDYMTETIKASTPKSKPQLAELNAKALEIGYNYEEA